MEKLRWSFAARETELRVSGGRQTAFPGPGRGGGAGAGRVAHDRNPRSPLKASQAFSYGVIGRISEQKGLYMNESCLRGREE